jgi:hypothetical protein
MQAESVGMTNSATQRCVNSRNRDPIPDRREGRQTGRSNRGPNRQPPLPGANSHRVNVFDNICSLRHITDVPWEIDFHPDFNPEYEELADVVQDELLAHLRLLEQFGPQLGRPRVDTLNGSRHANMKELRFFAANGVWRFAFAFDPNRHGIVLCGGDKSSGKEKRFYRQLIDKADARFDDHLVRTKYNKLKKRK